MRFVSDEIQKSLQKFYACPIQKSTQNLAWILNHFHDLLYAYKIKNHLKRIV